MEVAVNQHKVNSNIYTIKMTQFHGGITLEGEWELVRENRKRVAMGGHERISSP